MSRKFGMKEIGEDEDWTVFWTDYSVSLERVMDMKRFQVKLYCFVLLYQYIYLSVCCQQ